jgi:hypothetical protein
LRHASRVAALRVVAAFKKNRNGKTGKKMGKRDIFKNNCYINFYGSIISSLYPRNGLNLLLKFVFFVPIGEKFVFFGRDRPFYHMHFISRFFPFFTQKEREREKSGKTGNGAAAPHHGPWPIYKVKMLSYCQ